MTTGLIAESGGAKATYMYYQATPAGHDSWAIWRTVNIPHNQKLDTRRPLDIEIIDSVDTLQGAHDTLKRLEQAARHKVLRRHKWVDDGKAHFSRFTGAIHDAQMAGCMRVSAARLARLRRMGPGRSCTA